MFPELFVFKDGKLFWDTQYIVPSYLDILIAPDRSLYFLRDHDFIDPKYQPLYSVYNLSASKTEIGDYKLRQ